MLALYLSTLRSLQRSQRLNHDIVVAMYINKYPPTLDHVLANVATKHLLAQIQRPLFSIHISNPSGIISFTDVFDGFDLSTAGRDGKQANMDLVAILLEQLDIAHMEGFPLFPPLTCRGNPRYFGFLEAFWKAAVSRYRGNQQFLVMHSIPAVSLEIRSRTGSLQERTRGWREKSLRHLVESLQRTVETAGSVEGRLAGNAMTYLPRFSEPARFIPRSDVLIPAILLLASFAALAQSIVGVSSMDDTQDMFSIPSKSGLLYLALATLVGGSYVLLERWGRWRENEW